jgi:hypothetical protein
MWQASEHFFESLVRSHKRVCYLEVLKGGGVFQTLSGIDPETGLSIVEGSVQVSRNTIRRSLDLTISDPTGQNVPSDPSELFAPFVTELRVFVGCQYWDAPLPPLVTVGGVSGPTSPTLAAVYQVDSNGSNTSTLQTVTFTPNPNEVIVVKGQSVQGDGGAFPTPSGGSLTYTLRQSDSTASHNRVALWTAVAGSSPSSMTVSLGSPGATANHHSMVVERWTNAKLAGSPASNKAISGATGAPSLSLTTVAANSVVSWLSSDWTNVNGATRAYITSSATPSEEGYLFVSNTATFYWAWQLAATAGSQTFGLTAPTGQAWSIIGIEIQFSSTGGGTGGGTVVTTTQLLDDTEYVPVGTFVITGAQTQFPTIKLQGYDRAWYLSNFAVPYLIAANTNVKDAIVDLLGNQVPASVLETNLPDTDDQTPRLSYDANNSSTEPFNTLATAAGWMLYCDPMGVFTAVPEPGTDNDVDLLLQPEPHGWLIGHPQRSLGEQDPVNAVVFTGESTDGTTLPVRGYAQDDDPASFTYVGRIGVRPDFQSSPIMKTQDMANKAARTALRKRLGLSNTITVDMLPNPALEAGDVLHVIDLVQNMDEVALADSFTVSLRASAGPMGVTCRPNVIN